MLARAHHYLFTRLIRVPDIRSVLQLQRHTASLSLLIEKTTRRETRDERREAEAYFSLRYYIEGIEGVGRACGCTLIAYSAAAAAVIVPRWDSFLSPLLYTLYYKKGKEYSLC